MDEDLGEQLLGEQLLTNGSSLRQLEHG